MYWSTTELSNEYRLSRMTEYAKINICPNSYLKVSESQVLLVLVKFCLGGERVEPCLSQA